MREVRESLVLERWGELAVVRRMRRCSKEERGQPRLGERVRLVHLGDRDTWAETGALLIKPLPLANHQKLVDVVDI